MKTAFLILVMMIAALPAVVHAQNPRAIIQDIQGTVEIKAPGSSAWRAAAEGQALEPATLVSTGFKSMALIRVGNSTLIIRPLTRLSLGELQASAETEKAAIQLRAGRVRADVKSPEEGKMVDFTIRASRATASVRGTLFDFDTVNLSVAEGVVRFSGADDSAVYVGRGQSSAPDPVLGRTLIAGESAAPWTFSAPARIRESGPTPAIPGAGGEIPVEVELHWVD
jgi:hypothetical protein